MEEALKELRASATPIRREAKAAMLAIAGEFPEAMDLHWILQAAYHRSVNPEAELAPPKPGQDHFATLEAAQWAGLALRDPRLPFKRFSTATERSLLFNVLLEWSMWPWKAREDKAENEEPKSTKEIIQLIPEIPG